MNRKRIVASIVAVAFAAAAAPVFADATRLESRKLRHQQKVNQVRAERSARHTGPAGARTPGGKGTGSIHQFALTDASGLIWDFFDNIAPGSSISWTDYTTSGTTLQTSYTVSTTTNFYVSAALESGMYSTGATTSLTDMVDSYGGAIINGTLFNFNGFAIADAGCGGRQYVYPTQDIGGIDVTRKVYVPAADTFGRWLTILTNTTGGTLNVNYATQNNVGSDGNTAIGQTSDGDTTPEISDLWVATGGDVDDPRICHLMQDGVSPVTVSSLNFLATDDDTNWTYDFTLAAGETRIIMHVSSGQPTIAAAEAKCAELAALPPSIFQCMSQVESAQLANFSSTGPAPSIVEVPTLNSWGLGVLAVLLMAGGAVMLARRRTA